MPLTMRIWLRRCAPFLTAVLFSLSPSTARGQGATERFLNQQRQVEERTRQELQYTLPAHQQTLLDWGGWYTSYFMMWDDGTNSSRTLRRQDFRLWGSLNADEGIHQGYARMILAYDDFNHGDNPDPDDEDDLTGPNLDRGWYRLDLTGFLRKHGQVDLPFDFATTIGRDYVQWGTGYALSLPLDAVQMTGKIGDLAIDGLLGRTIHSWDNPDTSRPDNWNSWRYFYGVQARYEGFQKHKPFIFYLWQNDCQGDGNPLIYLQQWRYDSEYLGLGSTGELARNLRYSGEMVYESGRSYGERQIAHRNEICACGWDAELQYLLPRRTHPQFSAEYMFASGDPDRLLSPTNAAGGNLRFTRDNGFNAFGYRDTGMALAPSLSNIHIWRAGTSFFPFEQRSEWLDRLQVGADWFLYWKNHSSAAISDVLADEQSGYLGWEMDYFLNWRFTSDLAWTIRYGVFFPGEAYSDQTTRYFFLTGLTWNF